MLIYLLLIKYISETSTKNQMFKHTVLDTLRWEFRKENKKLKKKENTLSTKTEAKKKKRYRKKKEYMLSTKKPTKKTTKKKVFSFFLGRFLGRERVFFFFLIAFLVESVFSSFLTFLFSFINSHLRSPSNR